MANPTASLIIIGNEILSGRTQDANLNFLAKQLAEMGIRFMEARVIPDIEEEIVAAVNALRAKYDYVFTTGGIGPTHDDITTAAIAKAFGVPVVRRAEVVEKLRQYYANSGKELNDARLRMADFPDGAQLVENKVSSAPGFKMDNVFVMAGIPNIMQSMFEAARKWLKCGEKILSKEIAALVAESKIAAPLTALQNKYPTIDMGSYPFMQGGTYGTSIVMRGTDAGLLDKAYGEVYDMLGENGEILD